VARSCKNLFVLIAGVSCSTIGCLPAPERAVLPPSLAHASSNPNLRSTPRSFAETVRVPCGASLPEGVFERGQNAKLEQTFGACVSEVRKSLTGAQAWYVTQEHQGFPVGFGLEDQVKKHCLDVDTGLRIQFETYGICSEFAQAMIILRCVQPNEGTCKFEQVIQAFMASEDRIEWGSLRQRALPASILLGRHGQRVERRFEGILKFLDLLANHAPPGLFMLQDARSIEASDLAPYLAPRIELTDVNWKNGAHVSRDQMLGEAKRGRGKGFQMLAEVGWLYSKPYPQDAALTFVLAENSVTVALHEVKLEFLLQDNIWLVTKIHQGYYSDL